MAVILFGQGYGSLIFFFVYCYVKKAYAKIKLIGESSKSRRCAGCPLAAPGGQSAELQRTQRSPEPDLFASVSGGCLCLVPIRVAFAISFLLLYVYGTNKVSCPGAWVLLVSSNKTNLSKTSTVFNDDVVFFSIHH